MKRLAFAKTVFAAVICGTGSTAAIALYPYFGSSAIWAGVACVAIGFVVAAIPLPGRREP